MPPTPPNPRMTTRRVHFYRAFVGKAPDGFPYAFDGKRAIAAIRSLPAVPGPGSRYVSMEQQRLYAGYCEPGEDDRLAVAILRDDDWPTTDAGGILDTLQTQPGTLLAETTYVRLFPNNIVGAIFGLHTPAASRISRYMQAAGGPTCADIEFQRLVRPDIIERLKPTRRSSNGADSHRSLSDFAGQSRG